MEIKLKLKVKNVEIELSESEAKELCLALSNLVGEPKTIEREIIRDRPYWPYYPTWPYYPIYQYGNTTAFQLTDDVSVTYEAIG